VVCEENVPPRIGSGWHDRRRRPRWSLQVRRTVAESVPRDGGFGSTSEIFKSMSTTRWFDRLRLQASRNRSYHTLCGQALSSSPGGHPRWSLYRRRPGEDGQGAGDFLRSHGRMCQRFDGRCWRVGMVGNITPMGSRCGGNAHAETGDDRGVLRADSFERRHAREGSSTGSTPGRSTGRTPSHAPAGCRSAGSDTRRSMRNRTYSASR